MSATSASGWARSARLRRRASLLSRRRSYSQSTAILTISGPVTWVLPGGVGEVLEYSAMPDRRIVLSLARASTSIMPGPHPGCNRRSRERSPSGPATGPVAGRRVARRPQFDQRVGRRRRCLQRPPAAVLQPGDATGLLDQRHHAEAGPVGLLDDPLRGEDRADRRGGVRADGRGHCSNRCGLRQPVGGDGFRACARPPLIPATDPVNRASQATRSAPVDTSIVCEVTRTSKLRPISVDGTE